MYCPECGHQNPAGNKFCGMCGVRMPERTPNLAPEKRPTTSEMHTEDIARMTERQERIAEHDPEPVAASLRHREPLDSTVRESEIPAAVANLYSERLHTPPPDAPLEVADEEPTTVSGPSFLGLSSGSGSSSSYSYLYEDEQPSGRGGLVFLLFLAILAGGVYWKWQPIRDYVVNTALTHSGQGRPAPAAAAPAEPGSATASSDNTAAQPGQAANPNGLPQQDSATTTDQPKVETTQPKDAQPKEKDQAAPPKDSEKTSAPTVERPQSEAVRSSRLPDSKRKNAPDEDASEDSEKPAARRPAQAAAGAELVNNGERYLYGRGVPRNCSQALVNFNAAAKQENPKAMSHLGSLYATGQCVPLNRAQAYQWFSRALSVDRSNTYIEHNLNMLWRDMSSQERAQATQKKMF